VHLQGRPQHLRQVSAIIAQVVRDMTAEDVDKALSEEDAWMLALFQGASPCRHRAAVRDSLVQPALCGRRAAHLSVPHSGRPLWHARHSARLKRLIISATVTAWQLGPRLFCALAC